MSSDSKQTEINPGKPVGAAARKRTRSSGPVLMVAGVMFALAIVLFAPLMAGGATTVASSTTTAQQEEVLVSYSTVEQAQQALGFDAVLPQLPENATPTTVSVINETTLELVYNVGGSTLVYRTAKGSNDVSGDYTSYAFNQTEQVGQVTRCYSGVTNQKLNLVVWANDGYAYSLVAKDGLAADTFKEIAESIV